MAATSEASNTKGQAVAPAVELAEGETPRRDATQPRLTGMPTEIINQIAYYCTTTTPGTLPDPSPSTIYYAQREACGSAADEEGPVEAAAAAATASDATTAGPSSRSVFAAPPPAFATPPTNLLNMMLTSKRLYHQLNPDTNTGLYASVFRDKFDTEAVARRFGPDAVSSQSLTMELKRRCTILKRIRAASHIGSLKLREDSSPEECDAEMEENLWLAFLMLMENDGRNILQLRWAHIEEYLSLHHSRVMLESALRPQFPPDSADRALALHLSYLLCDPESLAYESRDESDEKLFVLRPFVFAAHKFDSYLAPWNMPRLPLARMVSDKDATQSEATKNNDQGNEENQTGSNPFLADLRPRMRSRVITHCGRQISIVPPNISHAACFSFFMKVERDPAVTDYSELRAVIQREEADEEANEAAGGASAASRERNSASTSSAVSNRQPSSSEALPPAASRRMQAATNRNPRLFRSRDHDKDMARLLSCLSPYCSPGLKPLFHAGDFEGAWEGRFSFFDFDSYREMLAGKMRSLYEGPFGEQPQVWKVREHYVKLDYSRLDEGGKGSILNAGFRNEEEEPNKKAGAFRWIDLKAGKVPQAEANGWGIQKRIDGEVSSDDEENDDREGGKKKERGPVDGGIYWPGINTGSSSSSSSATASSAGSILGKRRLDDNGIDDGDATPTKRIGKVIPSDWHLYPSFGDEGSSIQASSSSESDRYEILLSGTGHSAWGRFILRGRVRSWDGMMIMTKEYRPDGRGRWLYRGYAVAGGKLVGRWRDTFTPQEMNGYEGCFLLHRREDV